MESSTRPMLNSAGARPEFENIVGSGRLLDFDRHSCITIWSGFMNWGWNMTLLLLIRIHLSLSPMELGPCFLSGYLDRRALAMWSFHTPLLRTSHSLSYFANRISTSGNENSTG